MSSIVPRLRRRGDDDARQQEGEGCCKGQGANHEYHCCRGDGAHDAGNEEHQHAWCGCYGRPV